MQTDCRPQKRGRGLVGPCSDPLVGPRDPACRDALGAAPYSSCSCDRLVGLATSPSGRRTRSPHQKQTATVMLGRVDGFDEDEAQSKRDERAVVLVCLLAT